MAGSIFKKAQIKAPPPVAHPDLRHPSSRGEFLKPDIKTFFLKELPFNAKLKSFAKGNRKSGWLHESVFWERIKGKQICGLDFHRQQIIGNYIVDYFSPIGGIVIEIDGKSHETKIEYDTEREKYLEQLGLYIIHFSAKEVLQNMEGVIKKLSVNIKNQFPSLRGVPEGRGVQPKAERKTEHKCLRAKMLNLFLCSLFTITISCEKQEYYVSYYQNGIKKEEIPLENGVPNGDYKKWSITGFISERGFYKDSLPDGKWIFYAKENKPYKQGYFTKGKKSGVWTMFNEQGKILEENSCQEANAEGFFKSYSKEGKLLIYQECKFGKTNGVFMSYYPSGALRKVGNFADNLKNGLWVDYFANGKVMKVERWIANMRNGEWLKFGQNGEVVSKAEFIDGSGTFEDTTWQNNRIHGELKREIRDEYMRIEIYERGVKLSSTDYLKDSNKLLSQSFWKKGKKDSSWRTWWRSGSLKDSAFYKDGKAIGKHFSYDSTGKEYIRDNILLIK